MPLSDLQIALGAMVTAKAAGSRAGVSNFDDLSLTAAERDWLARLPDTQGFNVTCHIQRWWRETKLNWTTRLTLAALGTELADAALKDYLEATPCPSLFFTPEALGFLDFVASRANPPHVAEIARFERALLVVKEAAQQSAGRRSGDDELPSGARLEPHTAAALVEFTAPPVEILGALFERRDLPPASSTRFPAIIATGLPHLWRPATADEASLFTCCRSAPSVEDLLTLIPNSAPVLRRLLTAGALRSID